LVIPYREAATLEALALKERHEHIDYIVEAQALLTRALRPDGFNTGYNFGIAAGAGIPSHLHCHIVPRWNGDTNFMPVIGGTRVLPDALDTMWVRLREHVVGE
jgi:ATP adenylyltransferase